MCKHLCICSFSFEELPVDKCFGVDEGIAGTAKHSCRQSCGAPHAFQNRIRATRVDIQQSTHTARTQKNNCGHPSRTTNRAETEKRADKSARSAAFSVSRVFPTKSATNAFCPASPCTIATSAMLIVAVVTVITDTFCRSCVPRVPRTRPLTATSRESCRETPEWSPPATCRPCVWLNREHPTRSWF